MEHKEIKVEEKKPWVAPVLDTTTLVFLTRNWVDHGNDGSGGQTGGTNPS